MSKTLELAGQQFGRLTVMRRVESRNGRSQWECLCECGTRKVLFGKVLTRRRDSFYMGQVVAARLTVMERPGVFA